MASGPHTFVTMSVFSPERYQGNRLAVVAVRGNALTQQRKSLIAKEFGYSETVFIHDAPAPGMPRRIDIFTETGQEVPFAGHPVVGTAHYIFKYCESAPYRSPADRNAQYSTTVMTKAGPIAVTYNAYRQVAACAIPHDLHIHKQDISFNDVLAVQPQVQIVPTMNKVKDKKFPVVSIVKGMTFALIDLTDAPEVLAGLAPGKAPEVKLDEEWNTGLIGALYYKRRQALEQPGEPTIHAIQARMITQGMEDPGTGSACCALACYLALTQDEPVLVKKEEATEATTDAALAEQTSKVKLEDTNKDTKTQRQVYAIQQGVEMGRACMIAIELDVRVDEQGRKKIAAVTLSGRATFVSEGQLLQ